MTCCVSGAVATKPAKPFAFGAFVSSDDPKSLVELEAEALVEVESDGFELEGSLSPLTTIMPGLECDPYVLRLELDEEELP